MLPSVLNVLIELHHFMIEVPKKYMTLPVLSVEQLRRPNVPLHDADVRPLPGGDRGDRVVPAGRRDEGEDEQDAAELRRGPLLSQLHERQVSVI